MSSAVDGMPSAIRTTASFMPQLQLSRVGRSSQTDTRAKPVRTVGDTTSGVSREPPRRLVHEPGDAAAQLGVGLGEHPVDEVEDVAGAAAGAVEHVSRAGLRSLPRAEEHGAVEVPLDPAVVADSLPGEVEREPPVDADHVATRSRA